MYSRFSVLLLFFFCPGFVFSASVYDASYHYELSLVQTWQEPDTINNRVKHIDVRTYNPNSSLTDINRVPVYKRAYSSEKNSLGDSVGSVYNVHSDSTSAFIEPYNGLKRTISYPARHVLHTKLQAINDQRLAIGNYQVSGEQFKNRGFIYDLVYHQYVPLNAPDTDWTAISDINNNGQIIGTRINKNGNSRTGFIYNCKNGFSTFHIPGSDWTIPSKIDDEGNIYGVVSGIENAAFFIARPVSNTLNSNQCNLVPRDDVAELVVFNDAEKTQINTRNILDVSIGDFNGRGINDLLIYHGIGETLLYPGETDFNNTIRYYKNKTTALINKDDVNTEWDINNDGLVDKVVQSRSGNLLYLSKEDGSFYYIPQRLPDGLLKFGDFNQDGLVDMVRFEYSIVSVSYQHNPAVSPLTLKSEKKPERSIPFLPLSDIVIPELDPNATMVEASDIITELRSNSIVLSSGKILWISTDVFLSSENISDFKVGTRLVFKAWVNPTGTLIGIRLEPV